MEEIKDDPTTWSRDTLIAVLGEADPRDGSFMYYLSGAILQADSVNLPKVVELFKEQLVRLSNK